MVLMETAGRAVAAAVQRMERPGPIVVVCGPGNNGGDGYVVARALAEAGRDVTTLLVAQRGSIAGDAARQLDVLERSGGAVQPLVGAEDLERHAPTFARAAVVVDALFGVGMSRAVGGHHADVIAAINRATGTKVAVDIPSGLDADTGKPMGDVVRADVTVTFGALKVALVSSPGFAMAGKVEVADIGIPRKLVDASAVGAALWDEDDARGACPRASLLDHKGTRGHVAVIAGSVGTRGSGRLASLAALRAGAGLVTLAGPGVDELVSDDPSIMTRMLAPEDLGDLLTGKASVVIGPGMGRDPAARNRIETVLGVDIPAVIDADGLFHLEGRLAAAARARGPVILTPHPKEAARLLGGTVADVENDRLESARALAAKSRAVVVLKGARTVICDGTLGDEFCTINASGGPALATAGSGDVLAGVIGALLAQDVPAADAARLGVWIHGRAGDELAESWGRRGVIASDLPHAIARVIARL
jgi:NAD(P)H-hydrate epimerase